MTTIRLPWPPKGLQPHAKGHWAPKAKATAQYREWARLAALEAKVKPDPQAILVFTYHPPNQARRDVQNTHIQMKAVIDGIAAAMKVDDRLFRCRFPETFGEVVRGGLVLVEVLP